MELPSGTLTFLFTDIEGSTRLWEHRPAAMQSALAHHDATLRAIIGFHGGTVFKTVGDAFCASFVLAADGVAAALAIQQSLAASGDDAAVSGEPGKDLTNDGIALRVRTALHTGAAEVRDGDYFGPSLNRVARLVSVGHGGQVLLSAVTQELVRDELPPAAALKDLGSHRLKDLQRPERVFQLMHPDLAVDLPPLRSLDALPHNLPQQLTAFVGREKEIAEIHQLLGRTRLLTLTGAGGAGKTRLSLQVAADLVERFNDGVWFVEMAPVSDPALLPQAIASAIGLKESPGQSLTDSLVDDLRRKRLLLILDNCEHLVHAAARIADMLLRSCPEVQILTSSRQALGIAGELTCRVPPLSLPHPRQKQSVGGLTQYEAVRLFIDRAESASPSFAVTSANAPALAQICYRLDGIPLAIELAAARVRFMPLEQIAARLDDHLRLLTGGSRAALPRQQSLRAAIDWSYDLLCDEERALIRRLSIFPDGWTLQGADSVCADDEPLPADVPPMDSLSDAQPVQVYVGDVMELLSQLVDKSLVIYEEGPEPRYRMLQTIRQYALERLTKSGETSMTRTRHALYSLHLAKQADAALSGDATDMDSQTYWLDLLDAEHDNLRAALEFCHGDPEMAAVGLELAYRLYSFWITRSYYREGQERLLTALKAAPDAPVELRARALASAGMLAQHSHLLDDARSLHEASLALCKQIGDAEGMGIALSYLGSDALQDGDSATAQLFFKQAIPLLRTTRNKVQLGWALRGLGETVEAADADAARSLHEESMELFRAAGCIPGLAWSLLSLARQDQYSDPPAARTRAEESARLFGEIGSRSCASWALSCLAELVTAEGDYARARGLFEQSLANWRDLGSKHEMTYGLQSLAAVHALEGDTDAARARLLESLDLRLELGMREAAAESLRRLAALFAANRDYIRAARLYGSAEAINGGSVDPPLPGGEGSSSQVEAIRQALGSQSFAAAWEEGRSLSLDRAVAYARAEPEPSERSPQYALELLYEQTASTGTPR